MCLAPIAEDGLNADLIEMSGLPVVLVVPDRLGCINHALLTLEALHRRKLAVAAVVLNQVHTADAANQDTDHASELSALIKETLVLTNDSRKHTTNTDVIKHLADCLVSDSC